MPAPFSRASLLSVTLALAGLARPVLADEVDPHADFRFFENEVRPILVQRCHECHGEEKQRGDLRLDRRADFLAAEIVVPGDPDASIFVEAIRRTDPDFAMPPKHPLPAPEVAVLEKWVSRGAPWPEIPGRRKADAEVALDEHGFSEKDRNHWAFRPVADPVPPSLPGNDWVRSEIDRFIAAKQAELNLDPAPGADRRELVRRLTFNLHGLPPTPSQIEAFVADPDPRAYEKLVDSLLASPRYGERWAQHWLDLVRYAESDGYRQDAFRPNAWPYRDWVIRSLNEDLPYDEFVRRQLAADEIDPRDPGLLVANSYLRNGIYEYNLRDVRAQRDTILNDITDVTGEVFLGLSFSCARCHDHKFDPILQKDYFALRAFFEPLLWRTDLKLATDEDIARHAAAQAEWERATADVRARIDALVGAKIEEAVQVDRRRYPDDIYAMMNKPDLERTPLERQLVAIADRKPQSVRELSPLRYLKTDEEKKQYQALLEELKAFDALKPAPLLDALVATDVGPEAPPTFMKARRGEVEVAPSFLTVLADEVPAIRSSATSTGRRSALADWIARPDNPLAARVIVNRVWQYHFGRGLAGTPSDFGNLGGEPSHPELLDWLASRFVEDGWSLKRLHRRILLSATYRQTARRPPSEVALAVDPANRHLWRFPPRRLDAEQVRDAMLFASGELDLTMGGPSVDAATSPRRSIYTIKKRNSQNELLRALDAPNGFLSSAERQSTTTPTQALLLLNGDWPRARAGRLVERASSEEELWRAILGRAPASVEASRAEAFVEERTSAVAAAAQDEELAVSRPGRFKPETAHERLVAKTADREGEDFTVEAIVRVDSLDPGDGIRTIVSRWDGGRNSLESCGWSLGVAGRGSRFAPGSLVVQFLGENENANFAYEVVSSDLPLDPDALHYVSAYVSSSDHTVTFRIQNLDQAGAGLRMKTVAHPPLEKIGAGSAPLVLGGLAGPRRQLFDGRIEALRVAVGPYPSETVLQPEHWRPGVFRWNARDPFGPDLAWLGLAQPGERTDPRLAALAELGHVLLNTNEFFYLH
jgi:hypothetical protein